MTVQGVDRNRWLLRVLLVVGAGLLLTVLWFSTLRAARRRTRCAGEGDVDPTTAPAARPSHDALCRRTRRRPARPRDPGGRRWSHRSRTVDGRPEPVGCGRGGARPAPVARSRRRRLRWSRPGTVAAGEETRGEAVAPVALDRGRRAPRRSRHPWRPVGPALDALAAARPRRSPPHAGARRGAPPEHAGRRCRRPRPPVPAAVARRPVPARRCARRRDRSPGPRRGAAGSTAAAGPQPDDPPPVAVSPPSVEHVRSGHEPGRRPEALGRTGGRSADLGERRVVRAGAPVPTVTSRPTSSRRSCAC